MIRVRRWFLGIWTSKTLASVGAGDRNLECDGVAADLASACAVLLGGGRAVAEIPFQETISPAELSEKSRGGGSVGEVQSTGGELGAREGSSGMEAVGAELEASPYMVCLVERFQKAWLFLLATSS
jgi:hypothetical protein